MTVIRYLGRACIEIIGDNDHLIFDPNFIEGPRKGISKIFLTHKHDDHTDAEKILDIYQNYIREDKEMKIFGPSSVKRKISQTPIKVEGGTTIELNDGNIKVYNIDCWGAEECVGYLVNINDKKVLHTADSAKFSDRLRRIEKGIDLCFVACFEDYYDDYLHFIKSIMPKLTIPYHFGPDEENMGKNLVNFLKENQINTKFMSPGTEISL
jgi:L-ascorbate metabolism protein UlaG (beta-lactamase superfamily)